MKRLTRFAVLGVGLAGLVALGGIRAASDAPSPDEAPPAPVVSPAPAAAGAPRPADRRLPRVTVSQNLPPHERIEQMKQAMRLESPEQRVATLASHVEASGSEAERETGLRLIVSAGPPATAWEGLRRLFRSGPPLAAVAATQLMSAVNPALTISEMTDALTSPIESERQLIAVRTLRDTALIAPPGRAPAATALAYPGLDNDDAGVRREALGALTEVGTPMVADRIRDYATEESDPELRAMAEVAAEASASR